MKTLKGTRTEKNLLTAFCGESQARNRYTYFAGAARKEGFVQIEAAFLETADQEKEHAKRFFKFLEGGEVGIAAVFPAGVIGTTLENLKAAAHGEDEEWGCLYPDFAKVAKEEGFDEVAAAFNTILKAEKFHAERYKGFAANIEAGVVFSRSEPVEWRCRNCGYVHVGTSAPNLCPACVHPQAHFELSIRNW